MWVSDPPKRWQVGVISIIVSVPYYVWLILTAIHNGLAFLRLVIVVFWIYLILGYFVVKAVLRKLARNNQRKP